MPTSTRASRSPEGSSHELVRTLRAQVARAPRRARGAADARLLRRHPRPGRPHAAATRLDLPRKVAPHVRRLRTALGRAARPLARRRRRRPPAHRPRRWPRRARRQPQHRLCRRRSAPPRTASSPSSTRTARSGQASPTPRSSGSSFRDRATSARCSRPTAPSSPTSTTIRSATTTSSSRRPMDERRTRSMPPDCSVDLLPRLDTGRRLRRGRRHAWRAARIRRGEARRADPDHRQGPLLRQRVRAERMGGPRRQPVPRTARGRDRVSSGRGRRGTASMPCGATDPASGRSSRPRPAVSRSSTC